MPLTKRQQEVKEKLDQGLKPREIALLLGITTQAVYLHIKAIREAEEAA